jgi:hypothetical protein
MVRAMVRVLVVIAVAAFVVIGVLHEPAESKLPPPPATPLRYPDVQPMFAKHCAGCHDSRKGTNAGAQAVFEMSSYPFATKRPDTLLEDLRHMFEIRKALSPDDKWRGVSWIDGGALDADGHAPRWR